MKTNNPVLPNGYSAVPEGKLVNAVTCLEMCARPSFTRAAKEPSEFSVSRWTFPDLDLDAYRALFPSGRRGLVVVLAVDDGRRELKSLF